MAEMRVLHVIPSVGARQGGPSVAIRLIAEGLARDGVQVTIATTDDNGGERLQVPLGKPVDERGVTLQYFPRQLRFYTVSGPLQRWVDAQVRNYDLVHVHAVFSFASTAAARAALRTGVPYIIRPLGTLAPYGMRQRRWLKRLSFSLIERRLLAHAAAIHCTSQQEADEIRALGVRTRIVVIPLGLAIEPALGHDVEWLRRRAPQLVGKRIVLFLSRLDPKKGVELLLDAFAGLGQSTPAAALVIAGAGPAEYTDELKQRAGRLGINGNVFWAGHLDGTEKRAALQAADLFVLPSQAENFGIAAVEALAAGLPVVLSDQVGVHEAVQKADAGSVVPRDARAWTQALERLLADDPLRSRQAEQARQLARSEYSQEVMIARLLQLYSSVLR